ncbi:MAG: efflux transporter, family, subunit [Mycobacterium sp.]|nr:efflux transporter, family, subunit [Mycobacterium sp.]
MTDDTDLSLLLQEPFPEPEPATVPATAAPARTRKPRFSRRRAVTVLVVVVVLLGAASGGVWAATGSSAASYRWAAVSRGNVDQTLNSYGTVIPINQADVAFPVSGTIATVPVKVGQQVVSGQTLATIDITSLETALNSAESALATAQAKLVADTTAQANGTSSTFSSTSSSAATSASLGPAADVPAVVLSSSIPGGHSGGSTGGGSTGGGTGVGSTGGGSTGGQSGGGGSGVTGAQAAVTAAQKKLLDDQHTVDTLTAAVAADLRSGTTTCTSLITTLQGLASSNTGTGSSTPVPDSAGCTDLLNKVLADQQAVTTAQAAVSADETALTTAITNLVTAATSQPSTGPTPTPSTTPSTGGSDGSRGGSGGSGNSGSGSGSGTGSTGTGSSGRTSGGGATVTAADLVVDQTQVDAAAAKVTVAQESLKQAVLVSPLAGTVAEVDVTAGTSVSAASTAVIVIGPGNDQVSTTVGDLDLDKVTIGADATITPDGTDKPVQGKVTAVGLLPTSSTTASSSSATSSSSSSSTTTTASSSATYPVTISLDSGGLYSGSGADVAILIKRSTNVLTVPTSAVTTLGTLHSVTVLDNGQAVRKVVTVGASGPTVTEIKSGLTAGQHVVLARIDEALPTSGTTSLTGRAGGLGGTTGGLTGGTLTGGGATGGGLGGGGARRGGGG